MGSFPFANAVLMQKQVTHRSSSYSLEEKQRFNAYTGEERHLDGRSQQSGEWIVELSEETDSVWVWSHISREAAWRKIRVKEIIINLDVIFFFFFLLETQANSVFRVKKGQMQFTLGLNAIRWGYLTHFKTLSHCVHSFLSTTLFAWSIFR